MNFKYIVLRSSFIISSQFVQRRDDVAFLLLEDGPKVDEDAIVFDAHDHRRGVPPQPFLEAGGAEALVRHRH